MSSKQTSSEKIAEQRDLACDDHLLDEASDLLLEMDSPVRTLSSLPRRIREIEQEIYERSSRRFSKGIRHPDPLFIDETKRQKLTDVFGFSLFPWICKDNCEAWNLPAENRYPLPHNEWEPEDTENPFTEATEKLDALLKSTADLCSDLQHHYSVNSPAFEEIINVAKICAACWDARKIGGIIQEIETFARSSSMDTALYSTYTFEDYMQHADDDETALNEYFVLEALHLSARETFLLSESVSFAEVSMLNYAAECFLGAAAARILKLANCAWESNPDDDIQEYYLATKGMCYRYMSSASALCDDETSAFLIGLAATYRDASVLGPEHVDAFAAD